MISNYQIWSKILKNEPVVAFYEKMQKIDLTKPTCMLSIITGANERKRTELATSHAQSGCAGVPEETELLAQEQTEATFSTFSSISIDQHRLA